MKGFMRFIQGCSVLVFIGVTVTGFYLSILYYHWLTGMTGTWPKIGAFLTWFFAGGIEIIGLGVLIGIVLMMIGLAGADECDDSGYKPWKKR